MNVYFIGKNPLIPYSNAIKIANINECYKYFKDKKEVCIDIETTQKYGGKYRDEGLDPYTSNIVMFQIGDENRQYIIDYRYISISPLIPILLNKNIIKIGHNIKFEYKHLLMQENIKLVNLYDTMIVEQILYNGFHYSNSLAALNERYLGIKVDKETRMEFLTIGSKPFTEKQIIYGAEDVINPFLIKKKQQKKINKDALHNCIRLENLFIPVLGDIEMNGMNFNQEKWLNLYKKNKILFNNIKDTLDQGVIRKFPNSKFIDRQLDMFDPSPKCNIQWTSSKQVIEYFSTLNICPIEKSKSTGKLSRTVNATILKSFKIANNISGWRGKLIDTYLELKEVEQKCTTFGKDFLKYVNPITNRLHSNYRQILNTGRISSSNPNLQNIPSDIEYRKCFDSPENFKIVNADYSGQETIILANRSMEPNMVKLIQEGGDMHCFVTKALDPKLKKLSDKDIKENFKEQRQIAKSAGFAIQYGGDGYTISKNLGISRKRGQEAYEAYFKAFPTLKEYFGKVQLTTLANGYILMDSITRRKSWFKVDHKNINTIKRAALNYPIQGTAGSITKLAAILFRNSLIESGLNTYVLITNLVHDEINIECHASFTNVISRELEKCMKQAGDVWCKRIPLNATAVVSDYWGH